MTEANRDRPRRHKRGLTRRNSMRCCMARFSRKAALRSPREAAREGSSDRVGCAGGYRGRRLRLRRSHGTSADGARSARRHPLGACNTLLRRRSARRRLANRTPKPTAERGDPAGRDPAASLSSGARVVVVNCCCDNARNGERPTESEARNIHGRPRDDASAEAARREEAQTARGALGGESFACQDVLRRSSDAEAARLRHRLIFSASLNARCVNVQARAGSAPSLLGISTCGSPANRRCCGDLVQRLIQQRARRSHGRVEIVFVVLDHYAATGTAARDRGGWIPTRRTIST